jgi:hypothetical protein
MKTILQSFVLIISLFMAAAYAQTIKTPIENNDYKTLPTSDEISDFLHGLASESHLAKVVTLGKSAGGRDIEAVLISKNPRFLQNGQPIPGMVTVMLLGSQHGTEESGAQALQILVRDLLTQPQSEWLDSMNLVVIVNANPDGRDNKSRFNETKGNINIDYVALEHDETLIFVNALQSYRPNIILDLHEASAKKPILTDKQGYMTNFESQFDVNNNPNIAAPLNTFASEVFLPALIKKNAQMDVPARHYQGEILRLEQPLSHAGLRLWNFRNYSAMNGSISVLVENRLDPKQGNYETPENIKERTRKQYVSTEAFLATTYQYKDQILKVTIDAQKHDISQVMLHHERSENTENPLSHLELLNVKTGQTEIHTFPNFENVKTRYPLTLPKAYVITDEQARFEKLLTRHGLSYEIIKKQQTVNVTQPEISKIEFVSKLSGTKSYSLKVSVDEVVNEINLKPGDIWIPVSQRKGHFIPLLLDPRSSDSIFQEPAYRSLLLKNKTLFIGRVE